MSEIREKMMLEDCIRMEMFRVLELSYDDGVLRTARGREISYDDYEFFDFKDINKEVKLNDNRAVSGVHIWGDLCVEFFESDRDGITNCEAVCCSDFSVDVLKQVLTILKNYGN